MADGIKHWFDGLPVVPSGDGGQKYWFNGLPLSGTSTSVAALATLAATEAADGASFTGTVVAVSSGILETSEAADTAAFAGDVFTVATGTLAASEAADTADFAGYLVPLAAGELAAFEQGDGAAFTGYAAALGRITQKYSVVARRTVPHLVAQKSRTTIIARRSAVQTRRAQA